MRGIAVYASNRDDPYMTNHIDSDDEKDEVEIQPTDNLVVTAKIDSVSLTVLKFPCSFIEKKNTEPN